MMLKWVIRKLILNRRRSSLFVCLVTLTFLWACRTPSQRRYALTGDVLGIDRSAHQLIVHNDDIPNFMQAMTMPYQVKDLSLLERVQVGQRIKATLVVTDAESWVEGVQVTGQATDKTSQPRSQSQTPTEGDIVPDFTFTDQDGKRVHLAQFKGRVLLLTFIYTRCPMPDFCPRMTQNFVNLEKSLKMDPAIYGRTHLLSITLDPEFDTPKVLRQHALSTTSIPAAELFPHWEFLAPRPQDLDKIAQFFGLSKFKEKDQITHSLSTVIIDREGKLYRWYPGNSWTADEVLEQVRKAAGG
jgi:protein SCO1/2